MTTQDTDQARTALDRLVDEYLAACRARGLSIRTVREAYGYSLREVFLTSRVLDRLTTHLLDRGGRRGPLSKFTVATYVRAVNVFLGWARREGEVDDVKAQMPKLPRRLLDVLHATRSPAWRTPPRRSGTS